jgi:hypothetical protein
VGLGAGGVTGAAAGDGVDGALLEVLGPSGESGAVAVTDNLRGWTVAGLDNRSWLLLLHLQGAHPAVSSSGQ